MKNGLFDTIIRPQFNDFYAFFAAKPTVGYYSLAAPLLLLHVAVCWLSLIFVQYYYSYLWFIAFDPSLIFKAVTSSLPMAALLLFFLFGRFSFGYCLGFYFFTILLGFSWLLEFSVFDYDRGAANLSTLLSAIAFLVPAVFIAPKIRRHIELPEPAFERLLIGLLIFSGIILVIACTYHFRLVGVRDIYEYRSELEFPKILGYALGITVDALLPFTFTCFAVRGRKAAAAISVLMLLVFYPVTLTKVALFAPAWMIFLILLSRHVGPRGTVILSLLLPLMAGLGSVALTMLGVLHYPPINIFFGTVNFRMLAVPAISLDLYTDFFSRNPLTYFCQISLLRPFISCPYSQPLSLVLNETYRMGTLNASLFATEGIASLGLTMAPLGALACGLVVSLANAVSAHLPSRFVLISSSIVLQNFLNVPMTTTLLTNGAAALFLLWYVTPLSFFRLKLE